MKPVSIVHISDLHIELEPARRYPHCRQALDSIRPVLLAEQPDLLVVSGDLTTYGSADIRHLEAARRWLDSLCLPYLAVAGNHDLGANAPRGARYPDTERFVPTPFPETGFGQVFGPEPVRSVDLGPVRIIAFSLRDGDPDEALVALDRLIRDTVRPCLVYGHYPVVPTRQHGILAQFGYSEFTPNTIEELRTILQAPNVKLYGCGHVHANTLQRISEQLVQMSAGALGPGASTFRVLSVTESTVTFRTVLGTGALSFWDSLIPDFHESPEYHLGSPEERSGQLLIGPPPHLI